MTTFLLIFLFASLISSQSLMDVSLACIFVWGIFYLFPNKSNSQIEFKLIYQTHQKLFFSIFAFLGIVVLGYALSDHTPNWKNIFDFKWILFLPFLALLIFNFLKINSIHSIDTSSSLNKLNSKKLILVSNVCLSLLVIACLYTLVSYFLGYDLIHQSEGDIQSNIDRFWRAGGLFNQAMPLAHSYGPLLVFLISLYRIDYLKTNYMYYLAVILLGTVVILTYTRGVWLGVFISIPFVIFLNEKHRFKLKHTFLFFLSFVVLLLTLFQIPKVKERVLFTLQYKTTHDSERLTVWKANFEMFRDHPILGIGFGENVSRLREYYDKLNVPTGFFQGHAHNQYIHFLSGTGVLGLFTYLFIYLYFARIAWSGYHNKGWIKAFSIGCLGVYLCFAIGSLTEANFNIAKNRYLLITFWAFSLAASAWNIFSQSGSKPKS